MTPEFKIVTGDCREVLSRLRDESVHCVVTSPPYWGLRDYGVKGQLGLEGSFTDYVEAMRGIFSEVRRVLRSDGTCWLNLGDSYAGGGRGGNPEESPYRKQATNTGSVTGITKNKWPMCGFKPKDLCGIPWRVAFALQADGWYLRQDIIWSKPNPMPESVRDRCTKAHEYLFLLSKSERYYFDAEAIKEPMAASSAARLAQDIENQRGSDRVPGKTNGTMKAVRAKGNAKSFRGGGVYTAGRSFENSTTVERETRGNVLNETGLRNRRSVWTVTTQPFKEAHFATFPPALIEPCILAGCPQGGVVLDPFAGAGTTGLVAVRNNRHCLMIELNPAYAAMAERRILDDIAKRLTNSLPPANLSSLAPHHVQGGHS